MSFISTFRLVALGLSLLLGLVVLGLAAHWIQITLVLAGVFFSFEAVALVSGILAVLSLPMMLVVGLIRRRAFTSMIAVELPVLTVLWVLFLVAGALTAQLKDALFPFGCQGTFDFELDPTVQGWCREFFTIMGCSFIVWILLFLYTATLLVFALIGQSRGNTVWTTSVEEASFFANRPNDLRQPAAVPVYYNPAAAAYSPALAQQQYPMVQQQMGPAPGHGGMPQV